MNWRKNGVVVSAAMAAVAILAPATPAKADAYERVLAGIRLNSSAKDVLKKFGNPNQIVIGDVGVRTPPAQGGAGAPGGGGAMMGGGGMTRGGGYGGGAMMGGPGGGAMAGGGGAMFGGGKSGGGMGDLDGAGAVGGGGGMMGGPGGGAMMGGGGAMMGGGAMGGPGGGAMMGGGGMTRGGGGYGGGAMAGGGGMMGGSPGFGAFGQTTSTTARQQEVTWIYNRKFKDVRGNTNVVSYEFLIGPGGRISQIRVLGYYSKGTRTQRGVVLGSTYKDLVRMYGYPEEHVLTSGVLIASYKNRAHAQFQLVQSKPGADPSIQNYKIIAITIASVE